MRYLTRIGLTILTIGIATGGAARAEQPEGAVTLTLDQIADKITASESAVISRMRAYHPLVEVYLQTLTADEKLGTVPEHDEYFLGQFDWGEGPRLIPLSVNNGSFHQQSLLTKPFGVQYLPDGFASMSAPDWRLIDRQRYEFTFIRREFLGEARCLVFDVKPRGNVADGFSGRIWVEDRGFNIVRFNGISRNVDHTLSSFFRKKLSFHVDSWRVNVLPGLWLPAYVYCEETDLSDKPALPRMPRVKSQIRLWGYNLRGIQGQGEFTTIQIDEPSVQDMEQSRQFSPVQSQRRWEQEAEANVLDRLSRAGLLAPPGPVDAVLETVINNLAVTNNLTIDPPLKCRVLLTSPLESFTVGRTIVISRGLIDVLPDEASLAMVLGHEVSHVLLGHQLIDTKFSFADRLMIPDAELMRTLRFRRRSAEESAADVKVVELLRNSPYKDKLADAGLFLRAIVANAKRLPNLIQPHMGDFIVDAGQPLAVLMQQAPALAPERLDQIAALPLGARLVIDPWTDRVELMRAPAVPLQSAREKVPLAVTPLMPYITYAEPLVAEAPQPQ
ncbi:MAG: M48 family metalloprotease [Acidobacteria bacterium]|nr:M48 family metalloprotease [Acidobacteriota bacterium]